MFLFIYLGPYSDHLPKALQHVRSQTPVLAEWVSLPKLGSSFCYTMSRDGQTLLEARRPGSSTLAPKSTKGPWQNDTIGRKCQKQPHKKYLAADTEQAPDSGLSSRHLCSGSGLNEEATQSQERDNFPQRAPNQSCFTLQCLKEPNWSEILFPPLHLLKKLRKLGNALTWMYCGKALWPQTPTHKIKLQLERWAALRSGLQFTSKCRPSLSAWIR